MSALWLGRAATIALLLAPLAVCSIAQQSALFPGPYAEVVGNWAVAPVVTDLDGDGQLDVVSVSGPSMTVSIAYGLGGFDFSEPETHATGPYNPPDYPYPWDVAVGDFNEDGKPDLAVANGYMATVGVLLQGDGGFGGATQFAVGSGYSEPYSVAVGELNGDGHLDLVVPCTQSNVVSVLLGAGDGSFTLHVNKPVGSVPNHALVADVSDDGHADVLLTSGGKVTVMSGIGDGNFWPAAYYPAGQGPQAFALVDFDGDGQLDVVVASSGSDSVSILLGQADGSFGAPTSYFAGDHVADLGVVDLDRDGLLDVIALGQESNWLLTLFVLRGQEGGGLGPPASYAAGHVPFFGAATDLDRDGELDLVLGGTAQTIEIMPGLGGGHFETPIYSKLAKPAEQVAAGDMTGDGIPDLVATGGNWDTVAVLPGSGSGTFGPGTSYDVGTIPTGIGLADFDGDGTLDVAVANEWSNNVSVLLNQGGGALGAATHYHVEPGPRSMTVGDFDGDGRPDLAVCGFWYSEGAISVLLNQGSGVFGPVIQVHPGPYPTAVATADVNGDGRLDLLAITLDGLAVMLGRGGETFGAPLVCPANVQGEGAIAVGDLDGDAIVDCALAGDHSGTVDILLGHGGGQFAAVQEIVVGGAPESIAMGDLDDDGYLDIAATNLFTNSVTVLLNQGAASFEPPTDHWLINAEGVAIVDLDLDGRLDLAVTNGYTNDGSPFNVAALLNKGGQERGAWTNLGSGLAGTAGIPLLMGEGALSGGSAGSLKLSAAASLAPALLFVATSSSPASFKCGTLVPVPVLSAVVGRTDGSGAILLAWSSWPPGVTGIELFFQYAVQDVAAPCGVALSNALKAKLP